MIAIAFGANLPHPRFGEPRKVFEIAFEQLRDLGLSLPRISSLYRSAPWPPSDQPWYHNGVALVEVPGDWDAARVLTCLHQVEEGMGRVRSEANAARVLDLDLLDFRGAVAQGPDDWPCLPHPRLQDRAFVLLPLQEVCPQWVHPLSGKTVTELVEALPADQTAERLEN
ncbi:2-amino-4-hydroxy-6-hydroxymethyldihydropteridine diphosphokinase [Rhodovibrionaceae bacterium A322]